MKDVFTAKFLQEMCKTTANMYRLGWDERNGGNISLLLDEKDVKEYLDIKKVIREIPIGFEAKELAGKIFLVTGTGKYFKNVADDPENNLGIVRIVFVDGEVVGGKEVEQALHIFSRQRKRRFVCGITLEQTSVEIRNFDS